MHILSDNNIPYYANEISKVAEELESDLRNGLNQADATARLKQFGENVIQEQESTNPFLILLAQFKSPIVYLLLFAAGMSLYFKEIMDAIAILIVIVINAAIGFYMEFQAGRSMEALKKLSAVFTKVVRDGKLYETNAIHLVPGDVIFLEAGDIVPADARVIKGTQLLSDESALTGESLPVEKLNTVLPTDTPLAERINCLYKGTYISKGNANAIVTGTGMKTELGKIANMVETAEQSVTPLEKKLEDFSKKLIRITVVIVVLIFIAGILNGQKIVEMFETSIALAVAAIPEGLPIVATLALAQGMLKMAGHNVIVKKLSAVETLGGTTVICTDKTGTLTENRINVAKVWVDEYKWEGNGTTRETPAIRLLKLSIILCNTAEIKNDQNKLTEIGDPLETGLLKFAMDDGEDIHAVRNKMIKIHEEPFSSETKIMSTLHKEESGHIVFSKGAVEEILLRSTMIFQNNEQEMLNADKKDEWLQRAESMAGEGLRVVACAYRAANADETELSNDLVFIGLIGMIDPPRKDVKMAIDECHSAGIQVVMITGDHPATAKNIGIRLSIGDEKTEVMLGRNMKEYENLTEMDKQNWLNARVFARVSPKQKLDLIKLWQEKGAIVGMTGDGINDAPALKKADIGVAMGERGTQVAQEVADMIIKDDSFTSIVTAIKEGRVIFENIRKFVIYLLSCNLSELFVIAVAAIFNLHFQLFPLQILFINIITDVLPALALGLTEGSSHIMKQAPHSPGTSIIDTSRWKAIIFYSVVLSMTSVGAVLISHDTIHHTELWNKQLCNNILFFSLIFSQLFHVFNMGKSGAGFFRSEVFRNRFVWIAIICCISVIVLLYLIPVVREALSVYPMSVFDWMIALGSALVTVIIIQIAKYFKLIRQ